jgi:tetratricopeptide (TPR) repeat protein
MAIDPELPSTVGYKRPPAQHQFKPGRSGNPKGRPAGRPNVANLVKEALNKPVTVRIGGKSGKMSTTAGILHALTRNAAAGESAARKALLNIADMTGRTNAMTDEAHEKRALRLPEALTLEQMDFLHSETRERDRQLCGRMVDREKIEQQLLSASAIPAFIRDGDELERQGLLDAAFDTYQAGLASCREEIACDRNNLKAQDDFRCGVARLGLLADRLLNEGDFRRAIAFADAAIEQGSSEFWRMPKVEPYQQCGTNVFWLRAIRAHACMLLGRTDEARAFYRQFKSNKRLAHTSWETTILRDFVRLRKAGYSNALMNEIESHYAAEGWITSVVNTQITPPTLNGEDAVYVQMNPDELKSGDLLLKVDKPHDAMAAYLANLKKWSRNLEKQPHREDWKEHLGEAANRIVRTIDLLFRSGRFITALEYADQAVVIAPHLLPLQLTRACALMLLGQSDHQARSVFLRHRGGSIAGRSWDEAVRERFEDLRNAGCVRPLMEEIEHIFATMPASPSPTVAEGLDQRPDRLPPTLAANVSDIKSGDDLFADGRLDDALTVYVRRLRFCQSAIAGGRITNQMIDDRWILAGKISDVAMALLLEGEFQKALAATETYSPPGSQNPLPPLLDIRRAHALLLLDRLEEAKSIYLAHRGAKVDAGQSAAALIAQDIAMLQEAGIEHPLTNEILAMNRKE